MALSTVILLVVCVNCSYVLLSRVPVCVCVLTDLLFCLSRLVNTCFEKQDQANCTSCSYSFVKFIAILLYVVWLDKAYHRNSKHIIAHKHDNLYKNYFNGPCNRFEYFGQYKNLLMY